MGNALVKPCFCIPGFLLHGIGPPVQRKNQNVHDKAQGNNRKAGMAHYAVGNRENCLKYQLQRPDGQSLQNIEK